MKKGYRISIIFLIIFLVSSGLIFVAQKVRGATNIDAVNHWAWNDIIGWINSFSTNRTWVTSAEIQGYASTAIGDIAFNCDPATTTGDPPESTGAPAGSNCSINYKVSNDGGGNLSGWAWSDTIGWISFCGNSSGGSILNGSTWVCPSSPTYQATVNSEGQFSGWAWSDVIGWISFNCSNTGIGDTCSFPGGTSNYKTQTTWGPTAETGTLISSTFNTGVIGGVTFNYILWRGDLYGGEVRLQFAASNCPNGESDQGCTTGTWDFIDINTGGSIPPDTVAKIDVHNKTYFRYKIFITTNILRTASPVVEDVIVNWSP